VELASGWKVAGPETSYPTQAKTRLEWGTQPSWDGEKENRRSLHEEMLSFSAGSTSKLQSVA
jgi:hypothetical protein